MERKGKEKSKSPCAYKYGSGILLGRKVAQGGIAGGSQVHILTLLWKLPD